MKRPNKSTGPEPAKKAAKKNGRPTKRTPAVIRRIIDGLSKGTPLTIICKPDNMPSDRTVREWTENDEALSSDIARAREAGFDQIALDALNIADEVTDKDTIQTKYGEIPNKEWLMRSKLRVETRLKLLAKWDPKRYGERIHQELTGKDGKPIRTSQELSPELQEAIIVRTEAAAAIAAGVTAPASFRGEEE